MKLNVGNWAVTLGRKLPRHFSKAMLALGVILAGVVLSMTPAFAEVLSRMWVLRLAFSPLVLAESVLFIGLLVLCLFVGMGNALLMLPSKH